MNAQALVTWTVSATSHACDPESETWLTRAALSDHSDETLHRDARACVGLRRAGGRWQLVNMDRNHAVKVVRLDLEPLAEVWASASTAVVRRGVEYDLSDGTWWVAVRGESRWWTVAVSVSGQDRAPSSARVPGDDIPTNRNVLAVPHRWPETLHGAKGRVLQYLDAPGYSDRRLVLAHHYSDDLTGRSPALVRPENEVAADFNLALRRVSDMREQLQTKIWGTRFGHIDDLRRYLIEEDVLRYVDAVAAQDYVDHLPRDTHALERLAHTARAHRAPSRHAVQHRPGSAGTTS